MRYRHLGASGLEISEIGLGANSFGESWGRDYEGSAAVIHAALDNGINFIDTSNVYAEGVSEEYIGRALEGRRHEAVIGTKFGSKRGHGPNLFGGSRLFILNAVEASLKRLRTDYIDLYMVHRPDPRMPLEETLRTMGDLVRSGKVRYIGCCNFEAWRMVDALWTSKHLGIERFISSQFAYSLMNRLSEREMVPACRAHNVGILPYLPLAAGFLTGKVRRGEAPPADSRMARSPSVGERWATDANFDLLETLDEFASAHSRSLTQLAFAWLLANPTVTSVIAGATTPAQVAENAAAGEWRLTDEEKTEIDAILDTTPGSPPDTYYSSAAYFNVQTQV